MASSALAAFPAEPTGAILALTTLIMTLYYKEHVVFALRFDVAPAEGEEA